MSAPIAAVDVSVFRFAEGPIDDAMRSGFASVGTLAFRLVRLYGLLIGGPGLASYFLLIWGRFPTRFMKLSRVISLLILECSNATLCLSVI